MMKKLIYILILIIFCTNIAYAETQNAYLLYDGFPYAFKPGDEAKFLKQANVDMLLYEKYQTDSEKYDYLQDAMRYYFLLEKINPTSIEAQIGLARIYDEMHLDKYSKKHFYNALSFNSQNAKANFYFANFYYKRNDYINALTFYKKAYEYGYSKNYEINYRLGIIYEKLADIQKSQGYYKNALRLKPRNEVLMNKIDLLNSLDYSSSQYYLFHKKNK